MSDGNILIQNHDIDENKELEPISAVENHDECQDKEKFDSLLTIRKAV